MEQFFQLLKESVSSFHTVLAAERRLLADGFQEVSFSEKWKLQENGKYYVKHRDATLFAFTVGKNREREMPVRIAAAHTDFPGLYIKSDPEMKKGGYTQLNVEVYGSAILSTWMDRPLSAAGRVALRSEDLLHPEVRFVDLSEPFCTIPNLAIHMNREVNKGVELDRQKHMLPVTGLEQSLEEGEGFVSYLAQQMQVKPEDILNFDLYLYPVGEPCYVGMKRDLISASHLDNTSSVYALLEAITGEVADGINVAAMFDHEEIGSRTAGGAASAQLSLLLQKLLRGLGYEEPQDVLYDSMVLSVDVAHAAHPNYPEKADPVIRPVPGCGFCIKEACSQSYATDSRAIATLRQICDSRQIPYQRYVNNSAIVGGGTLANIVAVNLPVKVVDMGIPILAMHSSREVASGADIRALAACVKAFYNI